MRDSPAQHAALLQNLFLSAPFDTGGWPSALEALAGCTRSQHAQLLGIGSPHAVPFNHVTGLAPNDLAAYEQDFVAIGAYRADRNWRIAAADLYGDQIVDERHYAILRKERDFGPYEDHLSRWGGLNGCQAVLLRETDNFFGLALVRTRQDGWTSEEDRNLFATCAPMALAAIRMQHALEHKGAALMAGALDALDITAFLCDRVGRVQAMTSGAEAVLAKGADMACSSGQLTTARPENRAAFHDAFAAMLRDDEGPLVQRLWLADPGALYGGQLCEMFRLPRSVRDLSPDFGFAAHIMIVLRTPTRLNNPRQIALTQAFGLTATETQIALMLGEGMSREDIAQERGVSVQTVITQIRSIFNKCDTGREGEMVALVNRMLR